VQHKFEEYVAQIPNLSRSQRRALVRRMVTRWNTDLECIRSHVYFRPAVKLLTADHDLSLKRYELTNTQWDLADKLASELKVRYLNICSLIYINPDFSITKHRYLSISLSFSQRQRSHRFTRFFLHYSSSGIDC
jgi:hypothetical protein